tara:strand:- start:41 stop:313 length:273 start_codon:yes stop_codon:yes gene_type:complete
MARAGGRWKYVDKRSSCVVILSAAGEGCDFEYAAATVTESAPKTRALLDTRLKNGRKPDIPSLSLRSVAGESSADQRSEIQKPNSNINPT